MTEDNTTMANWMFYLARKLSCCPPDRREQEMAFVAASLKEQAMILLKSTTEPEPESIPFDEKPHPLWKAKKKSITEPEPTPRPKVDLITCDCGHRMARSQVIICPRCYERMSQ